MRGLSMPNLARKSAAMMRSVVASDSRVIADGTCASGKWVVASPTRNCPTAVLPTSSITTCGVPVRSARNSVCPVNGMPASLITLFCTGAVTIAANSPDRQPPMAASSALSTLLALAGLSRPACTGTASGKCATSIALGITPRLV